MTEEKIDTTQSLSSNQSGVQPQRDSLLRRFMSFVLLANILFLLLGFGLGYLAFHKDSSKNPRWNYRFEPGGPSHYHDKDSHFFGDQYRNFLPREQSEKTIPPSTQNQSQPLQK